jgi:hypothetical protein
MNANFESFNFEFGEIILQQLDLLNSVLDKLGEPRIFGNSKFLINYDSAATFYLRIEYTNNERVHLQFHIHLEGDGMRLDVQGLSESFEWSKNKLLTAKNEIALFFQQLLTSYVLFESCGDSQSKSRMYIFGANGELIEKYTLRGFIHSYSGWNCDKKLFFPICQNQSHLTETAP